MGFMDNFTSDSPVTVKQPDYYGSPKALSPYEVARQTRIQTRAMVIAMQRG